MNQPLEWTDDLTKNFWNYYSNFPEYYFTYQYGGTIVSEFSKYFKAGSEVLDYGCGTGFLITHLLKYDVDIYGTDVSENSVESVNKKYAANKNFKGASLLDDLIRTKKKFDVLCVVEVIEHLTDHHLDQLLKNIKHLLKPNGIVIFTTPNNEKLSDSIVFCPCCEHTFHRWQHIRSWNSETLTAFLDGKGLHVNTVYTLNFSGSSRKNFIRKILSSLKNKIHTPVYPHLVAVCGA